MDFYEQWIPMAIEFLADRDANPAFAEAVLVDVCSFGSVEADAHVTFQNFFVVVRALGICAKPIW